MSAKSRTRPRDLVLPVPLAQRPGAKARGLPRSVPAVRVPLGFSAISRTCGRRGWDSNPRYAHAYNGFRGRLWPSLQGPCSPLLLDFSGRFGLTPFLPYRLVPGCHFGFVSKSVSSA